MLDSRREAWARSDNEDELIARAKTHESDAWTDMYATNQPLIYRYIKVRVSDEPTAEDLT